jgi:putative pyruvate formate lyase activating enzyme
MQFRPRYLRAYKEGRFNILNAELNAAMTSCELCPHSCAVNRSINEKGICKTGSKVMVSSYAPHFGEEPPLVGTNGSGTIFFTNCNLLCNFCQNFDISHEGHGTAIENEQLAAIMLELQVRGCHNINFVTPSHVVPQIIAALEIAIENGLNIPLVYNTSAFDSLSTLKMLDGIIDIYMPDLKFLDAKNARNTCRTNNYPETAKEAISEMQKQVGVLEMDSFGIAKKGLLIRHLVMPGAMEDSKSIINFIADEISPDTFLNIMPQYRPCGMVHETPQFNRVLQQSEYDEVVEYAREVGLINLL